MNFNYVGDGLGMPIYFNNGKKTEAMDKTQNIADTAKGNQKNVAVDTGTWSGDVVVSQPPDYRAFSYDVMIEAKSKTEMTMDEYKQWVMREMSQMPVSNWYSSSIVGGALRITNECFDRMKSDLEWENTVMNMVREMYSTNGLLGSKSIGYQVIGASSEQCYGVSIPVQDKDLSCKDRKESWWQEYHEELEERLKEQKKKVQEKEREQKARMQEAYRSAQFEKAQRTRLYFEK